MNTQPRTLEARLANLERAAGRWRLAAVGLAGLVVVGAVVGFGPDKSGDLELMDEYLLWLAETSGSTTVPRVVDVVAFADRNATGYPVDRIARFWSDGRVEVTATGNWIWNGQEWDAGCCTLATGSGLWSPLVGAE